MPKFIKQRLQHRCFLVKFAKFLKTNFFATAYDCYMFNNQIWTLLSTTIDIDSSLTNNKDLNLTHICDFLLYIHLF